MKHNKRRLLSGLLYSGVPVMAVSVLCLTGCKEEFGGYYNQPSWVSASSAQVLKEHGDCSIYLQLVGKTLFSKQVEGSGQYTFLVPTDEAFANFFASNPYGYKSVDDIPEDVAARMVSSWMMYNSYPCDTLSNVLTGFNTWDVNLAFKHRTPSYDVLRQETIDGEVYQLYDYPYTTASFDIADKSLDWHNYRYLPIWTNRYNSNNSITSADWSKVVGSEFSPYGNYVSAGIIDAGSGAENPGDLYCQNGVIHLVNKVVMPLENMDALIRTYGDGSAVDEPEKAKQGGWKLLNNILNFKKGNGEYAFINLAENSVAKHYFEKMYPDLDLTNFRLRSYYLGNNPFLLNIENYATMALGQSGITSTSDLFYTNFNGGMTFFVPEKGALLNFINNRLFKYIGVELAENCTQEEFNAAFQKMSVNVPIALWQSMQSDGMIWPSQFQSMAVNSVGSSEHIDGYDDAITFDNNALASGIASNGMWHIINYVPKTAAFEGIASRFLLDPAYSIEEDLISMTAVYNNMLKSKLSGMNDVNLSLILWGDENAKWWDNVHYSTLLSAYARGSVGNETSVQGLLLSNIYNSYVEREAIDALDLEVDPLDGAYGGWAYTNNYLGGVMRYRKSGKTIDGKPEIQIQTTWSIRNDANERAWWTDESLRPEKLQQSEPAEGSYMSVVKDNSVDYVNGNVYTAVEHSAPLSYAMEGTYGDGTLYYSSSASALYYLKSYLAADAQSATPQHTIFKKYWDYYQTYKSLKGNADTISIGSGNWTIFVPTDAALQAAIDYGKDHDISLLVDPDKLPSTPNPDGVNWVDSVIYILNAYITKSGCYPDDGLSAIYETSEAWDGMSASNREAPKQYLVTTNAKITDVDRVINDKVVKPWDGLISGAQMSGYVAKTGSDNKLQYFGRPYTSGAFEVVNVYNSNEMTSTFDNTVVREAGQSNIIAPSCMIHSLNGFVIYKIASH